jgi:hypothetical protein
MTRSRAVSFPPFFLINISFSGMLQAHFHFQLHEPYRSTNHVTICFQVRSLWQGARQATPGSFLSECPPSSGRRQQCHHSFHFPLNPLLSPPFNPTGPGCLLPEVHQGEG